MLMLLVVSSCFWVICMSLKDLLDTSHFVKFLLVLWIFSALFVWFLLGRMDYVVHGDLYYFGLEYNLDWATPYSAIMRSIIFCLAVPSILSTALLGFGLWKSFSNRQPTRKRTSKSAGGKLQALKGNSMVISCPSCKKTFGKPLVMLDFSSGKAKLVNVCPYCNAMLGNKVKKDGQDVDVGILGPNQRVKTD